MKNNRYDKRRRSLKKARSVERVPVAEKVNDFNKRILASVLAFAIVISCMVVGVNLATRAEGQRSGFLSETGHHGCSHERSRRLYYRYGSCRFNCG